MKGGFMMRKILLLVLILTLTVSIVSCASAHNEETSELTTTENTTTENITTETSTSETMTGYGVFSPDTYTTQTTTVNHPCGGTGDCPTTETTTVLETIAPYERYELGMEYVRNYEAYIVTDEKDQAPYTSSIWYQNPYMTGDGILMFVSMENQLPHWIEEDVIPSVSLNENSTVRFVYHEDAELKHTGKFRIYVQDDDGRFYMEAELKNSNLSEVYAYGKENLSGKTVYISYPFMLTYGDYSYLTDSMWGTQAVHDIMCVFKTAF
jgi:hypothetical protein